MKMENLRPGKFLGIKDKKVQIEYEVFESDGDGGYRKAPRIFSYPYADSSCKHRDTNFHFGTDPVKGYPYDALPKIGEKILYSDVYPDMAGHLMLDVYPYEEV
jgi:hypothetical protein